MGITHATAATGTDSGDGKISKNAWNEEHVGGGAYLDSAVLNGTYGDEFASATLDGDWTATGLLKANALQLQGDTWAEWAAPTNPAGGMTIFKAGPTTDSFEIVVSQSASNYIGIMLGPCIVSSTGTGIGASLRYEVSVFSIHGLTSYAYASEPVNYALGNGNLPTEYSRGGKQWVSLRHVNTALDGPVYIARWSTNGVSWSKTLSYKPSAFTAAKIGWGMYRPQAGADDRFAIDRFNVVNALDFGNNLCRTPISGTATASASSEYSGGFVAANAVDGTTAEWASAGPDNPHYWLMTWSVGQTLNRVYILERAAGTFGVAHLELYDGATTHIVPVPDIVTSSSRWLAVEFPTVTGCTTLKIVSDAGATNGSGFKEFEAYLAS